MSAIPTERPAIPPANKAACLVLISAGMSNVEIENQGYGNYKNQDDGQVYPGTDILGTKAGAEAVQSIVQFDTGLDLSLDSTPTTGVYQHTKVTAPGTSAYGVDLFEYGLTDPAITNSDYGWTEKWLLVMNERPSGKFYFSNQYLNVEDGRVEPNTQVFTGKVLQWCGPWPGEAPVTMA